ncbi:MAG: hypothetical protein QOK18_5345 [Mycobacterium sp.]|jgi:2-methylisocitrate lyase-like PEP mutase family enzyme|nr:hypothetical protein [Mycobacterium sp.]MDT7760104.1 hypothetical protein [Mycobacterium sp.]
MPTTSARRNLRDLLDRRELIVAPGVFDGISAQLAKRTGHVAAHMTGAGVATSVKAVLAAASGQVLARGTLTGVHER